METHLETEVSREDQAVPVAFHAQQPGCTKKSTKEGDGPGYTLCDVQQVYRRLQICERTLEGSMPGGTTSCTSK